VKVAEPDPVPDVRTAKGRVIVPVNAPPERVTVKLPMIFVPLIDTVELKVPLPKFVSVAGPETEIDVPIDTVALVTVKVVEVVVVAFARTPAKIARAQTFMIPVICLSPPLAQAGKIPRKQDNRRRVFRPAPDNRTSTHLRVLSLVKRQAW
jgi:hypothetical protein